MFWRQDWDKRAAVRKRPGCSVPCTAMESEESDTREYTRLSSSGVTWAIPQSSLHIQVFQSEVTIIITLSIPNKNCQIPESIVRYIILH